MIGPDALRSWCLARPGVTEGMPFGPVTTVFKVEGKLFALSALEREPRHWNTILCDDSLPDAMIFDMIEDSYDLVVSALPRAKREALGWAPGQPE